MARIIDEASVRLRSDASDLDRQMSDDIERALRRASARARVRSNPILPDPEPAVRSLESKIYAGLARIRSRFSDTTTGMGGMLTRILDRDGTIFDRYTRRIGSGLARVGVLLGAVGRIGSAAFSAVTGKAGLLTVGIVAAVGALGGLLVAAPAILGALGVAVGAIALGMDGIKRAAQVAKPALEDLKRAVSDSFESSLRPAMQGIAQILPKLETGFRANATALGGMATQLVNVTNTGPGIAALQGFILQTSRAIQSMTPHIVEGQQAFLRLLAVAGPILPQLADAVGTLASQWARAIQRMADTGVLQQSLTGLVAVLRSVGMLFGQLMEVVGRLSASLGGPVAKLIQSISDGFAAGQADITRFGDALGRVISALAPVLGKLIPIILRFAASFAERVAPAVEAVAPILLRVADALSGMAGPLGDVVGALVVLGGALKVFALLKSIVTTIIAVGRVLGIWTAAQWLLNAALTANPIGIVVMAIAALVGAFVLAYKNSETFRNAVDGALRAVGRAVENVIKFFKELGPELVREFTVAKDAVVDFVMGAIDWLRRLPERAGAFLSNLASTVKTKAAEAWRGLVDGVSNAVSATLRFVADLPNKVAFALGYLAGMVYNGAVAAWRFLSETVPEYVGRAIDYVRSLPARIGGLLTVLGTAILNRAVSAWSGFYNTARDWLTRAVDFVRSIPGRVGAFLSQLATTVRDRARSAWQSFYDTARSLIQRALDFIRTIPSRVTSFLASLPGIARNAASNAWNGFLSTTRSLAQRALDFVRSIPERIRSFFSNAGSWLLQAGRDIIEGLLNGLKAAAGKALDYVKNLGSRIAAGFRSAVGARSPSVVFDRAGRDIMDGLRQGLESQTTRIMSTIDSIGAKIVARWQAWQARVSAASSGGMIQAEDGSWVPRSFYGGGGGGGPAVRMPAPSRAGMVRAEDGSWVPRAFYAAVARVTEALRRPAVIAATSPVRRPSGPAVAPVTARDTMQYGSGRVGTGRQGLAPDLDGISDAVKQGVYDGVAESLGPVSNEGLVRAVRKGEQGTGRL